MKKMGVVLIIGLFLGLVSSQSIMDLFMVCSTILGISWLFKNEARALLRKLPLWLWIGFPWFMWVIFGFMYKSTEGSNILSVLGDFIWIIQLPLLYLIWCSIDSNKKIFQQLLWILGIASFYAVIVYLIGFDPIHQSLSDRKINLENFWRTGGFFDNAMALAQSYGPLSALLLPLSILEVTKKKNRSIILLSALGLTLLAVLFTFTRGVWMAMIFSTLITGFIYNRKVGLIVLLSLGISGTVLLSVWPKFRERTFQVFDEKKSYDSERIVLWKTNFKIFKENPIMGIGYGENKRRLREYYDQMNVPQGQFEGHAHNQYLHFLAGTGIVGLVFYLLWCGLFLKLTHQLFSYWRRLKNEPMTMLCLGLLMAQITFHIGSLTESNFTISKNRLLIVFLWAFILNLRNRSLSNSDQKV